MEAITSPRNPRLATRSASISRRYFSEKQTLVNGDYLINPKNTLAMRFFYSTDPRTAEFNTPIGGALPGAPEATTILQHQRGAEADHHRVEYVRQ